MALRTIQKYPVITSIICFIIFVIILFVEGKPRYGTVNPYTLFINIILLSIVLYSFYYVNKSEEKK